MCLLEAFIIGICAWVTTAVLFQPGHLLEWYWNALKTWEGKLPKKYKWVAKPLGGCGFCFSGQMGFWFYILASHLPVTTFSPQYHLIDNLIFALLTIFFWAVLNGVDNLYKKHNG